MSDELIAAKVPLPRTHGLLGAMLESEESCRTTDIRQSRPGRGMGSSIRPRSKASRDGYRSGIADPTDITPYRDGPLLIRGDFRITDQDGNEIDPGRKTIALCRCGKSRMRPFCDGTHKLIDFRAPSGREKGREPG